MSEHPTERFERPPVPPADPDAATRQYPSHGAEAYPEDYNPLFDPPPAATEPTAQSGPVPEPPPVAPPPPPVAPPPPPVAEAPPAAAREARPSMAATVAKQWFNQSDNLLMAVTALVAVAFLVLVAVLP